MRDYHTNRPPLARLFDAIYAFFQAFCASAAHSGHEFKTLYDEPPGPVRLSTSANSAQLQSTDCMARSGVPGGTLRARVTWGRKGFGSGVNPAAVSSHLSAEASAWAGGAPSLGSDGDGGCGCDDDACDCACGCGCNGDDTGACDCGCGCGCDGDDDGPRDCDGNGGGDSAHAGDRAVAQITFGFFQYSMASNATSKDPPTPPRATSVAIAITSATRAPATMPRNTKVT